MKGRTCVRRRGLGGAVLVAVLALAAGSLGVAGAEGTAAAAGAAAETVLPSAIRTYPRNAVLEGYGDTGLLSQPEGTAHQQWTDYATGQSRDLTELAQWDGIQGPLGLAQSDTAYELTTGTPYVVRFHDIGTGTDRGTVTLPTGLRWAGTAGVTVVAYEGSLANVRSLHLLRPTADGGTSDEPVTGFPEGAKILAVSAKDARSLLLRYRMPTDDPTVFLDQLVLVDVRDGTLTKIFDPYPATSARVPFLSHDYVGWWYPGAGARLVRRDDVGGPVTQVPGAPTVGKVSLSVVGDQVVAVDGASGELLTMPLTGGTWRQLFPATNGYLREAPDGSLIAEAGTDPQDWGVRRLTESPEGEVVAREIIDLPPVPAPVDGLSLAGGTLTYTDQTASPSYDVMWNSRTVSAGSPPQVGPVRQAGGWVKQCGAAYACNRPFGLTDGSVVYDDGPDAPGTVHHRTSSGLTDSVSFEGAQVVTADGPYTVISGTVHKQYVYDWTHHQVVATRTATTATLRDGQLWTTASTAGHLTMTRLGSTAPAVDVNTGSACTPNELQVYARWIYWTCATQGKTGVFDRSRGRSVAVPAGDALLADGYLVRHDTARGKLVRTDVTSGKAVTADVADLPATPNLDERVGGSDRRIRWTLDPYTDRVAYVDSGERIHLLTGGTPAAPVRRDHAGRDGIADLLTLDSSGTLAFQQGTGTGTFAGKVSGSGWATSVKAVPFGDLSGDRCNDVLVRLSSGALRLYKPGCGAALKPSTPYTSLGTSGWNQYDVLTAPGDISGDGRPDLIARGASSGTVYLYKGTSTGKLSARVKLYADWRTYKKVVGVGDLNGDGIGDLLAQDKANNLYRYYGSGRGTFGARVKLFTAWGGSYDTVVGVGDITGDGKADLVERDSAGVLYRNSGDGRGSFGARTKISTGWQSYKGIF
ncbi:VCBS repeat-containing protein [Streptomyces sp. MBT65]|uniref:FG-GAP repeat domain-containing protein n=1 Tax=Streptomyces sp. MBT65 TaxID=1488395 RepID=UPI00190AC1CB|nr:VCBS repeat-containing protein [Streptomyces sp. MBT65]MBK3576700.1 VCBS repeat-containing protein [Streptomyces sp. MBT65]